MTYTEILKSIDWPTEVLVLDFETFFSVDYCMGKSKKAISTVDILDRVYSVLKNVSKSSTRISVGQSIDFRISV